MEISSKIVGVSSHDNEDEKELFMRAGLDAFVEKPLNSAKIAPILRSLQIGS